MFCYEPLPPIPLIMNSATPAPAPQMPALQAWLESQFAGRRMFFVDLSRCKPLPYPADMAVRFHFVEAKKTVKGLIRQYYDEHGHVVHVLDDPRFTMEENEIFKMIVMDDVPKAISCYQMAPNVYHVSIREFEIGKHL